MSKVPYVPNLQHNAQSAARPPSSPKVNVIIEVVGLVVVVILIEGNEERFFVRHLTITIIGETRAD